MPNKQTPTVKYIDLVELGKLCLVISKAIKELTIKVDNL
jgi:hypothetical protein